jgi:beta-xylosidase
MKSVKVRIILSLITCLLIDMRLQAQTNPVIKDKFTADPSAMVYNNTVYLYVGHDEAKGDELFTMNEWLCYSSADMKTWKSHGTIMRATDFKWAIKDAWAAQVVERSGKFYFYATVQHGHPENCKAIGVAVSDSPTGPFKDARGSALIVDKTTPSPNGWDDIDPTVLIDDDGTAWLSWGNPNCYLAKLKPNMTELDGEIQKINLPYYTEGPWLHKRNGLYYLTYAAFAHQGTAERICYATAPSMEGPWTYQGLLTDYAEKSYTIHPAIIEFKGQSYLFYHHADLEINGQKGATGRRAVCVDYLYYNPDGTMQIVEQTVDGTSVPPKKRYNTYTADNGNETYTNPILFEDIPDPAMVRTGNDYYLTSSTMHIMPGLPIWHSRDLVNWELINYAFDRFNLGPEFRFEPDSTENNRRDMYGRGIWAPAFVYHKGMFYIFANVNRHTVQVFQTDNPAGKWKHHVMKRGLHDLGVFFDDDDKKYVVWGAGTITLAELNDDLTDIKPETQKTIATGVGEGSHVYKINGKYVIVWAIPGATTPMQCGIADKIEGPYEVRVISEQDHQGYLKGLTLHQGGIIQTPLGEWWGYSMQDRDGIGRMTNLAPITWHEGFPYFGLPGNLTKTPRTWMKPDMGKPSEPITPAMPRSDSFDNSKLGIQWGWNHVPDDAKWSLTENSGKLRLHSLPADNFWHAKNTLTQKAIGPDSYASVAIDASALEEGDIAGLALLTSPYVWLGIEKNGKDYQLTMYKQAPQPRNSGAAEKAEDRKYTLKIKSPYILLKVHTDFVADVARFSYSVGDGGIFYPIGETVPLHFTMTTFQGIRYALFHFNSKRINGGYADFDNFTVNEPRPHGFRPIPYAKTVLLKSKAENVSFLTIQGMDEFFVDYRKLGRVVLRANDGSFVSVDSSGTVSLKKEKPDKNETFQWIELDDGSVALMSLATNRYLTAAKGHVNALTDIPAPDRKDGASFEWIDYKWQTQKNHTKDSRETSPKVINNETSICSASDR